MVAVHAGYIDTDMAAAVEGPKAVPGDVVAQTLGAVEQGRYEVLADDPSRRVKAGLAGDLIELYPTLTAVGAPAP